MNGVAGVRVTHGVTGIGQSLPYVHVGVLEVALYLAAVLRSALSAYENGTPPMDPGGHLLPSTAASYSQALTAIAISALMTPPSPETPYASSVSVAVDGTEILAETDHMTAVATYQPLGQLEFITLVVNATGIVSLSPAAG